jgi:hypothetical protein
MRQRANDPDPGAELEVRITWRQWHDGRWEAWVTDESGRPPHLVRDRTQLERFLSQAYRRRSGDAPGGSDAGNG